MIAMKVLFVEDQIFCQEAFADLLRTLFGPIDVDCATTVAAALEKLAAGPADLILVDFSSGDVCGQPGIEGIVHAAGEARVIAMDGRPLVLHFRRARAAGAHGYISKTSPRSVIGEAIVRVASGEDWFPEIPARSAASHPSAALSPRQTEVFNLLLQGLTNAEIASSLGISLATAKLHVHAVLKATRARSRTELVLMGGRPFS